jgi:hypothetical protein
MFHNELTKTNNAPYWIDINKQKKHWHQLHIEPCTNTYRWFKIEVIIEILKVWSLKCCRILKHVKFEDYTKLIQSAKLKLKWKLQRHVKIKSMSIRNIFQQLQIIFKITRLVQFFFLGFKRFCFRSKNLLNILLCKLKNQFAHLLANFILWPRHPSLWTQVYNNVD